MKDSGGADREEIRPKAFLGGEGHAAAVYELEAERDGRTLTESRVLFCRVENERIAEVWIYAFDVYALDDFCG